ncbi:MAG: M23 family metallopeptidase [Bdellovibrionota bacterium]|nr:M23 family metallopeptidase [Bdellovibrionota bacterium]
MVGVFSSFIENLGKNIQRYPVTAYLCTLCFFLCFPVVHTAKFQLEDTKSYLQQEQLFGGELILLKKSDTPYFLNHKEFSKIQDSDLEMAVVSVYSPNPIYISQAESSYPDWRESLRSYFRSKTLSWKRQRFSIQREELQEARSLRLPSSVKDKLSSVEDQQKKLERKITKEVLGRVNGPVDSFCYQLPVDSKRVSPYGRARRLPSGKTYYHTGLDLRAWLGTPIYSMGPGEVAYSGFMTSPGNNVMLDHGGGLFSRYMHFSKFGDIQPGIRIPANYKIGNSGSTGRSQAAHLHFEIIWKGNHASPEKFITKWRDKVCNKN